MYAQGLMYKQNVPADNSSIKIEPVLFEDGQVYTWSLLAIGLNGETGDKSFHSFKVIK